MDVSHTVEKLSDFARAVMPVCASVFSEGYSLTQNECFATITGDPRLMRSIRLSLR
jgi:hypothetical protein